MSKNIEQFGLYTIKIFDLLYDSFPVLLKLNREDIIGAYLSFDKHEELKNLEIKISYASVGEFSNDDVLKNKIVTKLPGIKNRKEELEIEQRNDLQAQIKIYEGTIEFLLTENFIREDSHGYFQLTSKSFSHLNKNFSEGMISEKDRSFIRSIKDALVSSPIEVVKSVAISVISSMASGS